jgi:hypothetical protein
MKREICNCDINGCNNEVTHHKNMSIQVIFTTEQTEGRSVNPYLDTVVIDICEECLEKVVKNKKYIVAYGAQGYNIYKL